MYTKKKLLFISNKEKRYMKHFINECIFYTFDSLL